MQNLSVYIAADSVVDYLGEYIKRNSNSKIECEMISTIGIMTNIIYLGIIIGSKM